VAKAIVAEPGLPRRPASCCTEARKTARYFAAGVINVGFTPQRNKHPGAQVPEVAAPPAALAAPDAAASPEPFLQQPAGGVQ